MRHDAPLKKYRGDAGSEKSNENPAAAPQSTNLEPRLPAPRHFFSGRRMHFALAGVLILGEIPPVTTWETNREQADASLL